MGWFSNQFNNAAGTFFGSDYLRDYTHASKTFRSNGYQYAPKFKFLFHVYFNINREAYNTNDNFGLAVKTVKLPSFTFDAPVQNQYNRKRIVYTKIKYDPVDISFHDDNGNMINGLWFNYFTYYFKDASKPNVVFSGVRGSTQPGTQGPANGRGTPTQADYNYRNIYADNLVNNNWGYIGENSEAGNFGPIPGASSLSKIPFFKDITIFGFNQHDFTAYTLINPMITRFNHDTYSYGEGNGIMENSMALDYETVVYNRGALDGQKPSDIVAGFGLDANYDRTLSPIARPGSNRTILGQGGLVDGVGGTIRSLAAGDVIGAVRNAGTTYNSFKGQNLAKIAKPEVTTGIINSIQGTPNRNQLFNTPIFGATPSTNGTAGAEPTAQSAPQSQGNIQNAGSATGRR
jgi:hypothetical protein